jgi:predicted metal-binding membrane protein
MARAMEAGPMAMMGLHPWTPAHFGMMFAMWAIMMAGMMLPSATPTTLVYAAVARKASREGTPVAPVATFVAGYLFMWTLFSLGATVAQWGLERAALLSPMMVSSSPALGGALLVSAGVYQLTPFKDVCLEHCRSPAHFIAGHWQPGIHGALRMGIEHGAYCLGCCWVLMGLLFFGGVMNLLWIATIALFVLLEKVVPYGAGGGRFAGVGMILTGALVSLGAWNPGG